MNFLFVCKFNRFRSKVSESLFKNYLKRKDVDVKSAGIVRSLISPFMSHNVVEILRQRGLPEVSEETQLVDQDIINWADKIIIVADNVPLDGFPPEKVEVWEIKDVSEHDRIAILMTINQIEPHIKNLAERINNKN